LVLGICVMSLFYVFDVVGLQFVEVECCACGL